MKPVRVLLVYSNPLCWDAIRSALKTRPDVEVIEEAHSAVDALEIVSTFEPDVILASNEIDGRSSHLMLHEIRRWSEDTGRTIRLAIFGFELDHEEARIFSELDVAVAVSWQSLNSELAITSLLELLFVAEVVVCGREVLDAIVYTAGPSTDHDEFELTSREKRVLSHLDAGRTIRRIADKEKVSLRTVERDIASLHAKLGAVDRFALGVRAARSGLLHY